ncbi:hypothetical protein FGA82_16405 [Pseudomonas fluorescens]|nr:hypothetical protein FGA82_16405 [Pseudomonas fluorescens]
MHGQPLKVLVSRLASSRAGSLLHGICGDAKPVGVSLLAMKPEASKIYQPLARGEAASVYGRFSANSDWRTVAP